MTTLTLLVKAHNPKQLKQVEDALKAELGDLDLELKILGALVNKWVQVSLSGEDEAIATNYLTKQIGTCPVNSKNLQQSSELRGYISKVDTAKQELQVDIGVFEPKIIQATIPLTYLQTQLADGRKVDIQKICQIYGFREGLPVSVSPVKFGGEEAEFFEAKFSQVQLDRIRTWRQSLLDRLIILRASAGEVETVLERTGLKRDVIDVEDLGFFEHAVTCKLGTDAAGLVSRVGRYMRNAVFVVYNSGKALGFIGEMALTL